MDIQRELKTDLTSIKGAIETQEGIYIPLKEVERLLLKRIEQARNLSLPNAVGQSEQLPNTHCTLNRGTCDKGSGCKYPHCNL